MTIFIIPSPLISVKKILTGNNNIELSEKNGILLISHQLHSINYNSLTYLNDYIKIFPKLFNFIIYWSRINILNWITCIKTDIPGTKLRLN